MFEALGSLMAADLSKKGCGEFNFNGLMKLKTVNKPATPARKGRNPFTGEEMMFKAKPASRKVRVRALRNLNAMNLNVSARPAGLPHRSSQSEGGQRPAAAVVDNGWRGASSPAAIASRVGSPRSRRPSRPERRIQLTVVPAASIVPVMYMSEPLSATMRP